MREMLRIGAGAGFSGDRLEPAAVLAERGGIRYLVLECLGERTVALAQLRKRKDPTRGYDPLLERRIELLLPLLKRHGVRLVTNMGPANPVAAADAIVAIAKAQKTPSRAARTCLTWRISAFPTPMSTPTAMRRWARSKTPAAASRWLPQRSNCSTR